MAALGLQCSCKVQYSDHWNKQALRQARQNYALLTKLEQLQKVYDILLGARNTITLEITLTMAGNYVLSGIQGIVYVGRATWLTTEFLPISFIRHSGM
jgi:hypothetical protein